MLLLSSERTTREVEVEATRSNTKQHYTPSIFKRYVSLISPTVFCWVSKVQEMLNQRRGLFPQTIEEIERWGTLILRVIFSFKKLLMEKRLTGGGSRLWMATWYTGRFSWPPPSNHAQQTCMVGSLNCENRFWTFWKMVKFHAYWMNSCRNFVSGVFGGLWIGPAMQTTSLWPCQCLKKRKRQETTKGLKDAGDTNLSIFQKDMSDDVRRVLTCFLRSSMKNALTNGWEGVRTAPFARRPGKIHGEAAFHALHYAIHYALLFILHLQNVKCQMSRHQLGQANVDRAIRNYWAEPTAIKVSRN